MATGYTAKLMKDGQTFQEFIMGCARAFGALIEMRDAPNGATIPEKFEPSKYHAEQLIESKNELERLQSMNDSEKEAFGESAKEADVKRAEERLEEVRSENERLENMAAQVRAWNPPTQDHHGLKDFMLKQIGISKHGLEYQGSCLSKARKKPATAYYVSAVSSACRQVAYHEEENAKEIDRTTGRTEWVQQLRASI